MNNWKLLAVPSAIIALAPGAGYATQYLNLQEVQKLCFPSATSFEAQHVIFTPDQIREIESKSGTKVMTRGQQIWLAKQGESSLGYLVVDYAVGKHLAIDYAVAVTPDGAVKQVEILEYRESYGGEIRNPDWLKQFAGKTSASSLVLNDDIMNIGGATLSSRHVTEGIKRVLVTFHVVGH